MVINSLPAELTQFIDAQVAGGDFASPEAVVSAALQLLKEKRERHRQLKADIAIGLEQIRNGEGIVIETEQDVHALCETIKREGRARLAQRMNYCE